MADSVDAGRVDPEPALLVYRSPTTRRTISGYLVICAGVCVFAGATASSTTTWWLLVPVVLLAVLTGAQLGVAAWRAGVAETADGLAGRIGRYRSTFAWSEIAGFEYGRLGVREVVVVRRTDGSGETLRGSRRVMVWSGGATHDFAALLGERLAHFRAATTARSDAPA
jgi:hypothetical protein